MLADPENSSQQQDHEHAQRNPPIPPILFAEEQEAGDHHPHHRSGKHQQHPSTLNLHRDTPGYAQAAEKPSQHDEEASESTNAEHQGDRAVELRLADLTHEVPPVARCTSK